MGAVETARDALFGNPPVANMEPSREGLLAAITELQQSVGLVGLGTMIAVIKDTRAHLDADLAHGANSIALVYADATDANNDLYIKVGASGSGSWTLTSALHSSIGGIVTSEVESQVAALVQPLVDDAADSAAAAASSASAADASADAAAASEAAAAASASGLGNVTSAMAATFTGVLGRNPAGWALGMDQAWDFTTGLYYGGAAAPTDTHAAAVWVKGQSGYYASVAINALARAEAVGLVIQPARTELNSSVENWNTYYTTTSGTGSATQNRRDPAGRANKAYTLTDSDASARYYRQTTPFVANDALSHTATIFVRKTATAPSCYPAINIGYALGTLISSLLVLDTSTGAALVTGSASWSVEDAGEFWRVSGSFANNASGNTQFFHQIIPAHASTFTTAAAVGATGSHVFAWASYQKDSFPATMIPAGGTAGGNMVVSDQTSYAGQAVAGLVTLDIRDPGATDVRLFSFDDATTDNYLAVEYVSGNAVLRLMSGTVEQAAITLDQWRRGRQTIAFVAGSNYVWGQFLRGDSVAADTSATFPATLAKLGFGGNSTSTATRRANVVIEKLALRFGVADANVAAEMLARGAVAHGVIPEAWDNFDRADGAIGYAPTGHRWVQQAAVGGSGYVLATISGKKLVAPDSGQPTTAAYAVLGLRQTVKGVRDRISFTSGATGGGAALILTKTKPTVAGSVNWIVLDGAVHIVFTDRQVNVGLYLDNGAGSSDFFELASYFYPTPMARDGTLYEIGYDIEGNTLTLRAPSLAPIKVTHERILNLAGQYFTSEHYWGTGMCQVRFHETEAW